MDIIQLPLLLLAITIFLFSGICIFKFAERLSGSLIILGSSSILCVQVIQFLQPNTKALTPSDLQEPYIAFELSIWNKLSFWVDPVGVFLVSLGVLILAYRLKTLNKKLQPTATAAAE